MKLPLALLLTLLCASAAPEARAQPRPSPQAPAQTQPDCPATNDKEKDILCHVGHVLPALTVLWDHPYEIPQGLPPVQKEWDPIKAALADPKRPRYNDKPAERLSGDSQ